LSEIFSLPAIRLATFLKPGCFLLMSSSTR
jgi:hypothetical protein